MEEDIIRVMKSRGLLITESRLRIIEGICRAEGIISNVDTFWLNLRSVRPISRATIYNTVRLMARFGILQPEYKEHGLTSYRLVVDKKWEITDRSLGNTL